MQHVKTASGFITWSFRWPRLSLNLNLNSLSFVRTVRVLSRPLCDNPRAAIRAITACSVSLPAFSLASRSLSRSWSTALRLQANLTFAASYVGPFVLRSGNCAALPSSESVLCCLRGAPTHRLPSSRSSRRTKMSRSLPSRCPSSCPRSLCARSHAS